jgi:hypothetical protein
MPRAYYLFITVHSVQVWDYSSFLNSLSDAGMEDKVIHKLVPLKVFSGHKDEGFAIDWSPLVTGRLVSGVLSVLSIFTFFAICYTIQNVSLSPVILTFLIHD